MKLIGKKEAQRRARQLRKLLGIPVVISWRGRRRTMLEHEAAHVVVGLALGGFVPFLFYGKTLGGAPVHYNPKQIDALTFALAEPEHYAAIAIAGSLWEKRQSFGLGDATMIYSSIMMSSSSDSAATLITRASAKAARLLRKHRAAVRAVADYIETHPFTYEDAPLRRAARRADPRLPTARQVGPIARMVRPYWQAAMRGDQKAIRFLLSKNEQIGRLAMLVRREIKIQKRHATKRS